MDVLAGRRMGPGDRGRAVVSPQRRRRSDAARSPAPPTRHLLRRVVRTRWSVPSGRDGGFEFDRQPDYWDPPDAVALVTHRVAGDLRRRALILAMQGDREVADTLTPEDWQEFLTPDRRAEMGAIDPGLLGGEFLPRYATGQTEIARIVTDSFTRDIVSLRARLDAHGIHYSAYDEYPEAELPPVIAPRLSTEGALTFGEMIAWVRGFESGWHPVPNDLFDAWRDGQVEAGRSLAEARDFVWIESPFYPQLREYFERRADRWLADRRSGTRA